MTAESQPIERSGIDWARHRLYAGWGLGATGSHILLYASNLLLLFYFVDFIGINAALAGWLILGAKIFDMVTDPTMGVISDRTTSTMGRRRPYLLGGSFLCGLSFVVLFNIPVFESQGLTISYTIGALLLFALAYTVFSVPYLAMPAEMTESPHERTTIMTYRVSFGLLGTFTGTAGGPLLVGAMGGGLAGYGQMGWILGAVIFVLCLAAFFGTARAPQKAQIHANVPFADQARLALQNRPFLILCYTKLIQLMGLASVLATLPFYTKYVLGKTEADIGLFMVGFTLVGILSMPVWWRYARRYGKRSGFVAVSLCYAFGVATWLFYTPNEPDIFYFLRSIPIGIGSAGILLMGFAMLPDTMEYDFLNSGMRREGMFSGLFTTVEKLANAVGVAVVGTLLGWMGFIQARGDTVVQQPPSAELAMWLGISAVPVVTSLLSCLAIWRYDLSPEKLENLRKQAKN